MPPFMQIYINLSLYDTAIIFMKNTLKYALLPALLGE